MRLDPTMINKLKTLQMNNLKQERDFKLRQNFREQNILLELEGVSRFVIF